MIKHYVMFCFPGSLMSEYQCHEIKSRRQKIEVPKNCFGYYFFDQEETIINERKLTSKKFNESGMRYFGKVYTLKEIKEKYPKLKTLIRNIEGSYKKAVKTRCGNWQPFTYKDKIIKKQL